MSWSALFAGHATTQEAEAEIVKALHELWAKITEHNDGGGATSSVTTSFHGGGTMDTLSTGEAPQLVGMTQDQHEAVLATAGPDESPAPEEAPTTETPQ